MNKSKQQAFLLDEAVPFVSHLNVDTQHVNWDDRKAKLQNFLCDNQSFVLKFVTHKYQLFSSSIRDGASEKYTYLFDINVILFLIYSQLNTLNNNYSYTLIM